ncbi:hemerythrin domain-containing protein [Croceivirga radicis]|uniref:Hemerythrin n=1 Tax=Croceivirga radicis TaxID=1929488 RepID=A0A1V6LQH4_9FLAO|nr:hemerythrin domain-containing protein [Croceivirga radicis]OQD42433.1 hemerythrin [Croceivirga radicis]
MKIFEAIRKDHDVQRKLLEVLVDTSGDSKSRRDAFNTLKKELAIHADGEERHFYIPLMKVDKTQDHARHGVAEHHEIDELVEKLEKTDYSSSAWLKYAKDLQEKVTHHLADEEHSFFQLAGKVLPEKELTDLAKEYQTFISDKRSS